MKGFIKALEFHKRKIFSDLRALQTKEFI